MRRFRPSGQMSDIDRPRSRRIQLLRRSNQHSSGEALGVEEGYGLGSDHRMDPIDRHGHSNRSIMVVLLSVAKSYFFSKGENSMQVVPGGNGHLTPIVIPLAAVLARNIHRSTSSLPPYCHILDEVTVV
mmetsp:Transcript_11842/g.20115  ORF Transcript_11842/g.20115 Transcript_11842/m.20115 type:complete len:129 (-) Transcript_11842:349-735(-)